MTSRTVLLLLAYACAIVGNVYGYNYKANGTAQYNVLLRNYENAAIIAKHLVNSNSKDPVNDYKRQYAVLATVLAKVASIMTKMPCASYDVSYIAGVNTGVPEGWTNPEEVAQHLRSGIRLVDTKIKAVKERVLLNCTGLEGEQVEKHCNDEVQAAIDGNPKKYAKGAELLKLVGSLSDTYLKRTYEDHAKKMTIISFLLTDGKEQLRELIMDGASLVNTVPGYKKQKHVKC